MVAVRVRIIVLIGLMLLIFLPQGAPAAEPEMTGSLSLSGDPGEPIGLGKNYSYSSPNDSFEMWGNAANIQVRVRGTNGEWWTLSFAGPGGDVLRPATYVRAERSAFRAPTVPGLYVGGLGRGCNEVSGTFKVLSINASPTTAILGIHVTFEQRCSRGATVLRGDLRIGVTGPDSPEPTPQLPVFPDTTAVPAFLNMTSDPGSYVGRYGWDYRYEASDLDAFRWRVENNVVIIQVHSAEGHKWTLTFSDPRGGKLIPGTYSHTAEEYSRTFRGVAISGRNAGCEPVWGTFEVTRAEYRDDGSLEHFQSSFSQRCENSFGELRGQISLGLPLGTSPQLNDSVSAWGYNQLGVLGDGTTTERPSAVTLDTSGFHKVAAGGLHSLGLKEDGSVWAWGWNGFGQLGDGTQVDRSTPVKVIGLDDVASISAGFYSNLAVKNDGTVWAWGWNGFGQVGDGTKIDRPAPVKVQNLTDVVEASAGLAHNLALKGDGTVWAWGWNVFGQVGDGTTKDRLTPVTVRDLTYVQHVSAGGLHSLALDRDWTVKSWGSNVLGQLGNGNNVDRHTPTTALTRMRTLHVSAGLFHNLANSFEGDSTLAWGWNGLGQLGDGTTVDRNTPVSVPGMTPTGPVSAGCYHSLGINTDGEVVSWGWNALGQLGNGTHADSRVATEIPRSAAGHSSARIAAGCLHSLELHRKPAGS